MKGNRPTKNELGYGKTGSKRKLRRPGVEPGSTAWKATMLAITPPTLICSTSLFSNNNVNSANQLDVR